MIKDKYLGPFLSKEGEREMVLTHGIRSKYIVEFMRSLSDEEISDYGNALVWLYPPRILEAFIENDPSNEFYNFAMDFRRDYKISKEFTMVDKHMGIKLIKKIKRDKNDRE